MSRIKEVIFLAALVLFVISTPAVAGYSPEFHQLVSEINGRLKTTGPGVTHNSCAPQMFDMAKQAIQNMMMTELTNKIVVEPLENGAKVAAGALGVPNLAVSTYGLVRCYLKEGDRDSFARCAAGEVLGFAGAQSLETFGGVEGLQNALAGAAWGKAYEALQGAVENYQSTTELLDHEVFGECNLTVTLRWNKRREPGAEGGKIWVYARAKNCRCLASSSLKEGWLRFTVPVHYTRAGSSQPGWTTGAPREYKLNATCCSSPGTDDRAWLYDGSGRFIGRAGDSEQTPAPPTVAPPTAAPPPVKPSPVTPPSPAMPQWSETDPCPECQPFLDLSMKHRRAAEELTQAIDELRRRLASNQERQSAAQARIDQLNREISGKAGEGGSAFDPDSGLTTEAWTQADGTVKITVKDAQGKVVEERTRGRGDLSSLRQRLTQEAEALARLKQEEGSLQNEILRQTRGRETQLKLAADARAALKQCIKEHCGGKEETTASVCTFQPSESITIGPKSEFGDSLAKTVSDKAQGLVGGLFGSMLSKGPISFGQSDGDEPEFAVDPVKKAQKQLFTDPGMGTAIRVGAVPDPQGGMRLSIDVDESKEKGVVHSVARETLDANCQVQREFPTAYWLYEIWLDWKLSVWWSKSYYVNNQLVKQESGEWFKEGRQMLDRGVFDANDRRYTPWGFFGFERPHKGPRSIGATFADWKIPSESRQMPERIVVQVSEPHLDPVKTTAFTLYPVYQAGGNILFNQTPPGPALPNGQPLKGGAEASGKPDGARAEISAAGDKPDKLSGQAAADAQGESVLDEIEPQVGTRVLPDGTRVTTRPDGRVEEVKPDGTRIEYSPDGTRLVKLTSNIWIQFRPDGTWVEYAGLGRITEYRPDGTIIRQESDGGVIEKKPDGTITHQRSDGTTATSYPDGTRTETHPDGSRTATFPDGSGIEHRADGSIHMQEAPKAKPAGDGSTAIKP